MRVFVTGATGFVGTAVVQELIAAGHQVLGLARSEASAAALIKAGAEVHLGSLDDLDSLRRGAAASEGVIHTAFIHDFSDFENSCKADREAIEAMGSALEGSNRPFIVTSGTAMVAAGHTATENDSPSADSAASPRRKSEEIALSLASRGVRVSIMRLPASVHGNDDHGFIPILIGIAREKGVSAYIGEGQNRWPAVHRLDAARLYRLALETAPAGTKLHAVDDDGIPIRQIAEIIGRRLNLPVVSKSQQEAGEHFGWFGRFLAIDNPTSSQLTRERFGWTPSQAKLLADLDREQYFLN